MHNLCVFCTFSTFAQKIFKGWGCNFTWSFGKVMRSKSMKVVFLERIIRHKLSMIYAFFVINLTTWGPLYTSLLFSYLKSKIFYHSYRVYGIVYLNERNKKNFPFFWNFDNEHTLHHNIARNCILPSHG